MLNDERKADLIEEKTYEKFVFGVWVKAIDDDDILAVAYNMVTAAGCACDSSNGSTWVRASGELNHLGSDPSRVILGRAGATSSSSVPPLPPLPSCAHGAVVDACDSSNGSTWVRASGELNHLGSDPSRVILGRAGATSSSSVPPLPPLPSCAHGAVVELIKSCDNMCRLCDCAHV